MADYTPTHYVTAAAPGGGDGSSGSPWTLAEAMTSATAGNIVQVGPGVYTGTANTDDSDDWVSTFAAYNDGTSGSPIIFFAQYRAANYYDNGSFTSLRSELRNGGSYAGQLQPVLGTRGFNQARRYVVYDGFYINGADGYAPSPPSRGSVLLSTAGDITLQYCAFDLYHYSGLDNYVGIFVQPNGEATQYPIYIKNNLFVGGSNEAVNHNGAAITTYYAQQLVIEHNEFRSNNNSIFIKGGGDIGNGGTIRYNKITSPRISGIEVCNVHASIELNVYQNLVTNAGESGIVFDNSDPNHRNTNIYNNTVIGSNPSAGLLSYDAPTAVSNNDVYNNIFAAVAANTQVIVNAYALANMTGIDTHNYNCFYSNGETPLFALNGDASISGIANWRTASSKDANSITSDPQFVNAASGNYKLSVGSPSLTASSTGGPIGAYITGNETIGIEGAGTSKRTLFRK